MLVADDRKEEYLAAGHKLAVKAPIKPEKAETAKEEPKKQNVPEKKSAPMKKK